jgi:hypothetical protein
MGDVGDHPAARIEQGCLEMGQFLPDPLTREEFAALKQIGDARKHETIPAKIRERLILIGYAKEVLGGLIVTDEGMLRIVMGTVDGSQ